MDNEMKDLAARMAADEANEGNYAAAAELQEATRTGPPFAGETSIPRDIDLSSLAWIGEEADRANAERRRIQEEETAGYDQHTGEPDDPTAVLAQRVQATADRIQQLKLEKLRNALEDYFGLLDGIRDDETAAGVAERELICERVVAMMHLAALAEGHPLPGKLVSAAKRVEELETSERARKFVKKSLGRLKPQLARRIAEVICPPLDVPADEVKGWRKDMVNERMIEQDAALEVAERLVEAGLRFVPTDEEIAEAQRQLRFVVAAIEHQDFQQTWDGALYDRPDDPQIQNELRDARTVAPSARPSGTWGVFGLVRVPDETVFGGDRG